MKKEVLRNDKISFNSLINILRFADHQIIISGPHTEKFWEPLH